MHLWNCDTLQITDRIAEFEWAIILGIVLTLGVWDMLRTRRLVLQDREKARGTRNGNIN